MIGAKASRCALLVAGSNETTTHLPFFSVPQLGPRSPVSQYFAPARFVPSDCPSRTFTAMLNSQKGCSACLLKYQGQNRWKRHASTKSAVMRRETCPAGSEAISKPTHSASKHRRMSFISRLLERDFTRKSAPEAVYCQARGGTSRRGTVA